MTRISRESGPTATTLRRKSMTLLDWLLWVAGYIVIGVCLLVGLVGVFVVGCGRVNRGR